MTTERNELLLGILVDVTACLNQAENWDAAMYQSLPLLGAIPDLERITITELRQQAGHWFLGARFDWRKGQVSGPDYPAKPMPCNEYMPNWLEAFLNKETVKGQVDEFQTTEQRFMRLRGSTSLLAVPVWMKTRLWGVVIFSTSLPERSWGDSEASILKMTALNMGAILDRFELTAELAGRIDARTQEVEAGQALLRSLNDVLPDLIFYKDLQGRYLSCNQAFEDFTGQTAAQLQGRLDSEVFGPEALSELWLRDEWVQAEGLKMFETWADVFGLDADMPLGGELSTREDWVSTLDGPKVYLETRKTWYSGHNGQTIGLIGISRNLTRRKLAENAMQENLTKFRQLIDTLPVGIFGIEAAGDTYFSNQMARRLLGEGLEAQGSTAALADLPYRNMLIDSEQDYPPERHPLTRAYLNKEVSEVTDLEVLHADGRRVPMYVSGTPVLDAQDQLLYAITAFTDISESRRKEAELTDSRQRAEAASRAKSEFLANMSHEIRTPMNAIIGLNHLLLKSELAPKQLEFVQKMQNAAQSLLKLINDILDFSKIEAGKLPLEKIPFDLRHSLSNLVNLLGLRAQERNLELRIQLEPDLPVALIGDPLRLEQVLINLVGNGIKFTEQGTVTVQVALLSANDEDVSLRFSVSDTGIGIPKEQQEQLFQVFAQADSSTTRKYGGSGLGLSISKRLVELMGGRISFRSEDATGSEFYFTAHFGRQRAGVSQMRNVPSKLQGLRILVVDDNPMVLDLAEAYLQGFSPVLDLARSRAQAIAMLEDRLQRGETYDLLLVDWKLDIFDGFALIEHCWSLMPERPYTILMTAYGREDVFSQSKKLGLDGILLKPLTPSQVFDAVLQAFGAEEALRLPISQKVDSRLLDPVRGAQILLVEDNDINQLVACELLEAEGFQMDVAWDGAEALEKIMAATESGTCVYDLVLMDIHMPVMDGYTATRKIRALPACANLPIVAMTADAVAGVREQVLAVGMNDFVTKPIVLEQLFGVLSQYLPQREQFITRPQNSPESRFELLDLAEISGLEAPEALQRLNGNLDLYLKLLRRFAAELPKRLDTLFLALQAGEQQQAQDLAHTLKGAGGNLGLMALQAGMIGLEHALRQNDWTDALEQFDHIRQEVQVLLPQLSLLPEVGLVLTCPEPDERRALIEQLSLALQNYDPSAGDLLVRLKPCLSDAEAFQALEALLDDFDFEAALLHWQELKKTLAALEAADDTRSSDSDRR